MARIIVADDHRILRESLRDLLCRQPDMEVIAEAADGRMAVTLAKELKPDVVIIDITMPGLNGIEATGQIVAGSPGVKVVGLSMHSDERFITRLLQAGAAGYVLKSCAFAELVTAIHTVLDNQMYLGAGVMGVVAKAYLDKLSVTNIADAHVLTPREREVLQLLAEGKTTKQIAGVLYITAKTVETHRKHIMDKLNLHSVAELTKYALREGLTSLES